MDQRGDYRPSFEFDSYEQYGAGGWDLPDSQTEWVPETQAPLQQSFFPLTLPELEPKKRSHKKKQAGESSGSIQRRAKRWTVEEECALARAWVDVSENQRVGVNQTKTQFWDRIRALFWTSVGNKSRTVDMISGHWNEIRRKVGLFGNLYNKNWPNRKSGQSDFDVYNYTMDEYFQEMNVMFSQRPVWEILKKSTKWHLVPLVVDGQLSKRTKTSSSQDVSQGSSNARTGINLNNPDDEFDPDEELPRPPGRNNKAGAKNKGIQFGDIAVTFKEGIERLTTNLAEIVTVKKNRQRYLDMKTLAMNVEHLNEEDREFAEMTKNEIREEYRRKRNNN
ncbi:uncharacterized protein LOC110925089 [Helianthus annuus]|uniref:uncharacterized protein LOC110925089 n=1 Tax=Helianthus annuus TaxID=4232 RepID=UPI000B8FDFD5|nr:uncharacterized protein LOC110925089 [Helianthus annuus]